MYVNDLLRTLARTTLAPILEAGVSLYYRSPTESISKSRSAEDAVDPKKLPFGVDVVYTWVDSADPDWQEISLEKNW